MFRWADGQYIIFGTPIKWCWVYLQHRGTIEWELFFSIVESWTFDQSKRLLLGLQILFHCWSLSYGDGGELNIDQLTLVLGGIQPFNFLVVISFVYLEIALITWFVLFTFWKGRTWGIGQSWIVICHGLGIWFSLHFLQRQNNRQNSTNHLS